jgi:hypothetical protein
MRDQRVSSLAVDAIPTKFSKKLSAINWIPFILEFRANAVLHFKEAAETIKLEKAQLFPYPRHYRTVTRKSIEWELMKMRVNELTKYASSYGKACSDAVDIIDYV